MAHEEEYAVEVSHVSKDFVLPHEQVSSLKGAFMNTLRGRSSGSDTQHALRDIDFKIKKGEFFGIVGRNGSGKSTLLKILAGIYQPNQGSVKVEGKLVPFIELGVGFNAELTGKENVYLNGALLGFSEKEIDERYEEIVAFAELEGFMNQKLKNYSSGMQVRLAFSVATTAKADVLLVDEVLAVGDADFQRKCFNYFQKLKAEKTTVVFVTHDMNAVREYCDRAMLIEQSRVVSEGRAGKVAGDYARLFIDGNADGTKAIEENTRRWGNQELVFSDVSYSPSPIKGPETFTIRCEVTANKTVEEPLVGFSVETVAGVRLLGSNNKIEGVEMGTIKKGEKRIIEWSVPNVLNDGEYLVNVSAESKGLVALDWWDEALSLRVYKDQKTPYIVDPDLGLTVKKANEKN